MTARRALPVAERTVAVMPYGKLAKDILKDLRAAERDLAIVDRDRDERLRLEQEIERLRDEYERLSDEAARKHQVEDVPPFPPKPRGRPADPSRSS